MRNSVLAGMITSIDVPATQTWDKAAATAWFQTAELKNVQLTANTELGVVDAFNLTAPKFNLTAESVLNSKSVWDNTTGFSVNKVNASALTLYPNPAQSEVSIVLPFEQNSEVSIQIVDVTGREVYNKQTNNVNRKRKYQYL